MFVSRDIMVYRVPPRNSGKRKALCIGSVSLKEAGPELRVAVGAGRAEAGPSRMEQPHTQEPGDQMVTDCIL